METATLATEPGLALAIAIIDVTTTATSLAGVPRVHVLDGDAFAVSLVGEELLELEEVPLMELGSHLLTELTPVTNITQIFKDDGASWFERTDDLLGNDVIHVGSEPSLLARNLRKVPLSRTCLRFLQLASQASITITDVLDHTAAVELIGGSHGDLLDSTIHTNNNAVVLGLLHFLLEDDTRSALACFQSRYWWK